jgi:NAD-specific glutamate dehydrogenase
MKMTPKKITVEVFDEDRRWYSFNRKREYIYVWVIEHDNTYIKFEEKAGTSFIFWSSFSPILLKDNILRNDEYEYYWKYLFAFTEEKCNEYIKLINDKKVEFAKMPLYKLKTKCDEFKIFKKCMYYKFYKKVFTVFTNYQSTDIKIDTKEQGFAFIEFQNCTLNQEWVDVK